MVYVKRVELSRFKSFGGSNSIPFLPGFTVISGPNGSGKSNILDALLFCLGLASSKGMRAERLPDLINNSQNGNGKTLETVVSVTFDLGDLPSLNNDLLPDNYNIPQTSADFYKDHEQPPNNQENLPSVLDLESLSELKITRRLRVTKGGSYASTFYLNDNPCTATELHEQLNRLRIYPEGYNVVLQGDVTRIITMNGKERREIIDELAGVAEFDRKITQTKITLDAVKEREEKCHIIQDELIENSNKLKQDSEKAAKYQKFKAQVQEKKEWLIVINWHYLTQQEKELKKELNKIETQQQVKHENLFKLNENIDILQEELVTLNQEVKALGEDEQIKVASKLATEKLKRDNLLNHQQDLLKKRDSLRVNQDKYQGEVKVNQQDLLTINQELEELTKNSLPVLKEEKNRLKQELEKTKKKAGEIASQSQAWVSQQTKLRQDVNNWQQQLNPALTERALWGEKCTQLQTAINKDNQHLTQLDNEITQKKEQSNTLTLEINNLEVNIQNLAEKLAKVEAEIFLNQETITRLENEQWEKQRQIDKLEATRQAQQEAQGTYASKIILNSDLPGILGLVAQLGEVSSPYQLPLEIAAGSRLGFIVVEDDAIASMAINYLKQHRGGRATFLPLNKISPPYATTSAKVSRAKGFIDLAVNLIDFEPIYQRIFTYVFGNTVVFEDLNSARNLIGECRIVTLDGELLETSGAMTGGSVSQRSSLHFGKLPSSDSSELKHLCDRTQEIDNIKAHLTLKVSEKREKIKGWSGELNEVRQQRQKKQLILEQNQGEIKRLEKEKEKIIEDNANHYQEWVTGKQKLDQLEENIPILEEKLREKQEELKLLESSYDNEEWQKLQEIINDQELLLENQQNLVNQQEQKITQLVNEKNKREREINDLIKKQETSQEELKLITQEEENLREEIKIVTDNINQDEILYNRLGEKLRDMKQKRDNQEKLLKSKEEEQKRISLQLEKLILQSQELQTKINDLTLKIEEISQELPNPIPEIPQLINTLNKDNEGEKITFAHWGEQLEQIKKEISKLEKKIEALEPVNMLALEQYEKSQERLEELSNKLSTLKDERTELLLRIENFTTLRLRAFKESFDAVNENFKTIFATLSDGDGYLKLEDENNPFNGGLTLVAHPKGKAVQRLSSMSGGEKSLTALSFIFALQRYRPSPFYAFDEVDMFLDGANVEKLSKMIQTQAQQAQFIVVSLRRPMIEASQRTIGVTQARGAYTQVLGIKL